MSQSGAIDQSVAIKKKKPWPKSCHSFAGKYLILSLKTSSVDDAVKVLHSICQQIWKTQQWPQDWKGKFSFQSQRRAKPKENLMVQNYMEVEGVI